MHEFIQFFLVSIVALLPLVNPIGNALVSKARGDAAAHLLINQGALAAAIFVLAIAIFLCYRFSSLLLRALGKTGANALTKIIALLVLLVGVAMLADGLKELFPGLA